VEEIGLKLLPLSHRLEISHTHEHLNVEESFKANLAHRPCTDLRRCWYSDRQVKKMEFSNSSDIITMSLAVKRE
jgi:hypothetical protein